MYRQHVMQKKNSLS
nr:unnamed protein product [Callosobruchus analis]